jgi:hypothetical protein
MEIIISGTIGEANLKAMVNILGKMEVFMKASFKQARSMVKANGQVK